MRQYYLVGDVGGTNCRLQLFRDGRDEALHEHVFKTQEHSGLAPLIMLFLQQSGVKNVRLGAVCLAIAGPVEKGEVRLTNVSWHCSADVLAESLGLPRQTVTIVNDFVAVGYGLPELARSDVIRLSGSSSDSQCSDFNGDGESGNASDLEDDDVSIEDRHSPIACVGAGTGLGMVYATHNGDHYVAHGTEGGHANFAPRKRAEFELREFIRKRDSLDRVSVERVVSGSGILRVYEFFLQKEGAADAEDEEIAQTAVESRPAAISRLGLAAFKEGHDNRCLRALRFWLDCYANAVGDYAISTWSASGIYVAGGIAPKLAPLLLHKGGAAFHDKVCSKGRVSPWLKQFPLYLVINEHVGLLGARAIARRNLRANSGGSPSTDLSSPHKKAQHRCPVRALTQALTWLALPTLAFVATRQLLRVRARRER
ncbi:MAG: hypothetical protein MHM6MM_001313 [Cercozoa sp. M6MM]